MASALLSSLPIHGPSRAALAPRTGRGRRAQNMRIACAEERNGTAAPRDGKMADGLEAPSGGPRVSRRRSIGAAGLAASWTLLPPGRAPSGPGVAEAAESSTVAATIADVIPTLQGKGKGIYAIQDPSVFRGIATPPATRKALQLDGLLPAGFAEPSVEVLRAEAMLARVPGGLAKYQALISLLCTDREVFYAVLQRDIANLLPIVYTPTVGDACLEYGSMFPRAPGLFVSALDKGKVAEVVSHWPSKKVKIAVITDGERILGLGDIGAHGMGIAVGKSMVYSATGALPPESTLPITLDVGTENVALREDPLYLGLRQPRVRGEAYIKLVDELVDALQARYGQEVIIHWEDFKPGNAFKLLQRYQPRAVTFNDDIQSTAAAVVGGVLGALRVPGTLPLKKQRFLFFGAGQANIGVAELLVRALVGQGVSDADARAQMWLFDSKGLIIEGREGLSKEKMRLAQKAGRVAGGGTLLEAVKAVKPTALIGAATVAGAFTKEIVQSVAKNADRPIVMALSNPSSKSECTALEAMTWSGGKALFASGSPFPPSEYGGKTFTTVQANNCLVFPGLVMGVRASGANNITPDMFFAAATALSRAVTDEELARGSLLPPVERIGDCTVAVGAAVAREAVVSMVASTVAGSYTSGFLSCLADGSGGGSTDSADGSTVRACVRAISYNAEKRLEDAANGVKAKR